MARVAVCLFFLTIFQIGIIKSSADETITEAVSKNNEETVAKPTEDKSEVTTKAEPKVGKASDASLSKDDKPNEEKAANNNESKKENVIEKITGGDTRRIIPDILAVEGVAGNQTKVLFDVPKTILGPVKAVGARINEVVAKSLDTAKDLAGGTYNFLRSTFNAPFGNK